MDKLYTVFHGTKDMPYYEIIKNLCSEEKLITQRTCYILINTQKKEHHFLNFDLTDKHWKIWQHQRQNTKKHLPYILLRRLWPFRSKIARDVLLTGDYEAREMLRELSRLHR